MSASHQVTTLKPTVKWNVSTTKSSPVSSSLIVLAIRLTGVAISFGPNMLRTPSVNQPQVSHPSNVYWVSNLPYSPGRGNLQICLPSTPGSNSEMTWNEAHVHIYIYIYIYIYTYTTRFPEMLGCFLSLNKIKFKIT